MQAGGSDMSGTLIITSGRTIRLCKRQPPADAFRIAARFHFPLPSLTKTSNKPGVKDVRSLFQYMCCRTAWPLFYTFVFLANDDADERAKLTRPWAEESTEDPCERASASLKASPGKAGWPPSIGQATKMNAGLLAR